MANDKLWRNEYVVRTFYKKSFVVFTFIYNDNISIKNAHPYTRLNKESVLWSVLVALW